MKLYFTMKDFYVKFHEKFKFEFKFSSFFIKRIRSRFVLIFEF